jgi:hypothetical protein
VEKEVAKVDHNRTMQSLIEVIFEREKKRRRKVHDLTTVFP